MKIGMNLWTLTLTAVLVMASFESEAARRLGGGQSIGRQSPAPMQRDAAPSPAPTTPAGAQQAQRQPAPQAQPGAAAGVQPQRSRVGGMLGGLAAGLGLAWLAHSLGLGEAFANILLFALVGVVGMLLIGMVMRSRRGVRAAPSAGPYAFQNAGTGPESASPARGYDPDKIGNDASARPWERASMAFDSAKYAGGAAAVGSRNADARADVPTGFDTQGFLEAAKRNFVTLQGAWDRADITTLRAMMTDEMASDIGRQLAERARAGGTHAQTEVLMLQAQLLGVEVRADDYLASVEFSGMLREDPSAGPSPFREVWNMAKPRSGTSGWLVADVQALQ